VRAHVDPAVLCDAPAPGPVGGAAGSGTV
jgi:hypothetical protein